MATDKNSEEVLLTPQVDRLATLVEEATRATTEAPKRFIEPARGTLERAKSKRHHLVFGRRGSGKTSLLRKALSDLSVERTPAAFVDLEAFKGHSYPDVLLSILIETFRMFDAWLATAGTHPSSKVSFWQKLFFAKPSRPPLPKRAVLEMRQRLQTSITDLRALLHAQDDAQLTTKHAAAAETLVATDDSANLKIPKVGGISAKDKTEEKRSAASEVLEVARRNKTDFLHRHIIDYQQMLEELVAMADGPAFIFLDDLYHIRRADQADVLDYFHRIVKGRSVWLKVGTIRHRTEWYHHGDPPIGLKMGDDADDIDLDITLEKYQLARKFLLAILDKLVVEAGLTKHTDILADGGIERLVLASGGVARDFLTILRRAIDVARERREKGDDIRGPKIGAEDVNSASGEHDTSKRDELKRDTLGERAALENALAKIQQFCVDREINCMFVPKDDESDGAKLIHELVDLRFLHLVKSRITVRDRQGINYTTYMLDVSQYTGSRKRRELQMVKFWDQGALDRLRRETNVFDPATLAPAVEVED